MSRPDCDALMAGPLGTWLGEQQGLRDETRAKVARYTFWAFVAGASLALFGLIAFRSSDAMFIGGALGFAPFGIMAGHARMQVTNRIKAEINSAIAGALGLAYSAEVSSEDTFDRAIAYGMFPDFDDWSLSDEWSGRLGEHGFLLHELHLTEERGAGNSKRTITVFQGVVIAIGFARRFHSTTLVEREDRNRGFFGGKKMAIKRNGEELSRIEMVNAEFEDTFAIWTTDPTEAHYLVHPEYIERLVAVEQAWHGQDIRALFHDGELLIVLEADDMFESGSLDSRMDRALLEESADQFYSLAELARELNERAR